MGYQNFKEQLGSLEQEMNQERAALLSRPHKCSVNRPKTNQSHSSDTDVSGNIASAKAQVLFKFTLNNVVKDLGRIYIQRPPSALHCKTVQSSCYFTTGGFLALFCFPSSSLHLFTQSSSQGIFQTDHTGHKFSKL